MKGIKLSLLGISLGLVGLSFGTNSFLAICLAVIGALFALAGYFLGDKT